MEWKKGWLFYEEIQVVLLLIVIYSALQIWSSRLETRDSSTAVANTQKWRAEIKCCEHSTNQKFPQREKFHKKESVAICDVILLLTLQF